jgi:hypothetical protein
MAVEFETVNDKDRWKKTVKNVGEILGLEPEKILNYIVIGYDGTPELKADTDFPEVADVVAVVAIFLEHVTGKTVRFDD